jgi:VIT1/CCC1 family predicted Fe2+/Mn2+ transporter
VALFGTGAIITVFTGVSAWRSRMRQLLMGLAAAFVTFGIGKLIGIALAG